MNLELARTQMVFQQIRTWDVLDPKVLDVMAKVPRERFVPPTYANLAFADTNVPLAHDQTMMTPKVEGRMLQALDVRTGDSILEVGTGSGFVTACLADLGARVLSVDIFADFTEAAKLKLNALEIRNVTLETRDSSTLQTQKRYDVIAVTGSLPQYEGSFQQALNIGGRLFMIVGEAPVMSGLLVTRVGENAWARENLFETMLPALINAERTPSFVF